jgi:hypothetical protein
MKKRQATNSPVRYVEVDEQSLDLEVKVNSEKIRRTTFNTASKVQVVTLNKTVMKEKPPSYIN